MQTPVPGNRHVETEGGRRVRVKHVAVFVAFTKVELAGGSRETGLARYQLDRANGDWIGQAVGRHDGEGPAAAHASHIHIAHIHVEAIITILARGTDWLLEFGAADADLDFSAAFGEHADLDGFV